MEAYQNPLLIKIQSGTQNSQTNLCATCRYCAKRRSAISGKEAFICEASNRPFQLTEPMSYCNRFLDANHPTVHEMQEIAWQLATNQQRVIGFLSPEELRQRNQNDVPASPRIGF